MNKPKFYQAVLQPLTEEEVLNITKGESIAKRMGEEEGKCEICGKNEWWLLPTSSASVREGGKPYMECINCGNVTHL